MNKEKIKEIMTDTFVRFYGETNAECFLDFLDDNGFTWVDGEPLRKRSFILNFGRSLHELMYRYRDFNYMETDGISILLTDDEIEGGERIITFKEFLSELTGFSIDEEVVPVNYDDIEDTKTDRYFGSNMDMIEYMNEETRGRVDNLGMNPTALVPYVKVRFEDGNVFFYHPEDLNNISEVGNDNPFDRKKVSDFHYGEMVRLKETQMLGSQIDAKVGDIVVVVGHTDDFVVVTGYNWRETQVTIPSQIEKLTE